MSSIKIENYKKRKKEKASIYNYDWPNIKIMSGAYKVFTEQYNVN